MLNTANAYIALGRYEDALHISKKVLDFQRRVLPENHPDIGEHPTLPPNPPFGFTILRHAAFRNCHVLSCCILRRTRAAPRRASPSRGYA